jgi:hypothetical protein
LNSSIDGLFRVMTEPASASPNARHGVCPDVSTPLTATWFRTREGRRFGWELTLVVLVKLALLALLWLVFIQPWPRPVTPAATVVQQLYLPVLPLERHD